MRVQINKISQFGLMEISRQRIGQSIYEIFYNKCDCCGGAGFKKTNSILMHNIISNIKGINAIGHNDEVDIQIDESFYDINSREIKNKIKSIKLPFKVNFIKKTIPKDIYEFDKNLLDKVKNNTKEILQKINLKT